MYLGSANFKPIQDGPFLGGLRLGEAGARQKDPPSTKSVTHPTMQKLDTIFKP